MLDSGPQIIDTQKHEKGEVVGAALETLGAPIPKFNPGDALVYAFVLLLNAAAESLHTAQTRAKELNAARSRITALIREQSSLMDAVLGSKGAAKTYYMVTGHTCNGGQAYYFGTKPPTTTQGFVEVFNGNDCYKADVNVHSVKGKTYYVVIGTRDKGDGTTRNIYIGTKPLQPCSYNANLQEYDYCIQGNYYHASQINARNTAAQKQSGYKAIGIVTMNQFVEHDDGIEKARAFLTNKMNILKQSSQIQETGLSTTSDMEGQIIQQGMKIASLLEQLASQISQL